MKKKEEEQSAKLIRCGMGLVLGGVAALAVCFVFLLVASAAISGGLAGEELMYQLTIVGCVLGAFAGGLLAVRRCGSRALIVGLTTGGVLFLLLLTIGALCFETVSLEAGGHRPAVRLPVRRSCRRNPGRRGVRRSLPGKNAENN
ncbi:MAG: TIGR04086 family membrane protein [Flavonifractor plautii]